MEKISLALALVLALLTVGLLAAPTHVGRSVGTVTPTASHLSVAVSAPAVKAPTPSIHPKPMTGFPRTVLVETFTGVWCPHCPAETKGLFNIDKNSSHSYVAIAELHACAYAPGTGPCLENYVPPDNTSTVRGNYYSVCGYPDVYINGWDGGHHFYPTGLCGASNSVPQMQNTYADDIRNESMWPGNVSIAESASVVGGNVSMHANITSALNGTYNVVSYLLEFIDKRNVSNGGGPHDLAYVVRETLRNRPVSLTPGGVTEIGAIGHLLSGWKTLNLSVITFVQDNSTRNVENANMIPVTTLATGLSANLSLLHPNQSAQISVKVVNSSTGAALAGASVSLSSVDGGTFTPSSGTTASDGTFSSVFTSPTVPSTEIDQISANVSALGYVGGVVSTSIVLDSYIAPESPTAVLISPSTGAVFLNWTVPSVDGNGVNYLLYRATTQNGVYSQVGVSKVTSFSDSGVALGQTYWYRISAEDSGGVSANSTAVSATAATVQTTGLPSFTGWWFAIDSANFSSPTSSPLSLFLPTGSFAISYGADSYGYVPGTAFGTYDVTGAALVINATFSPRLATLTGSISPANATVSLDGNFAVPVSNGVYTVNAVSGDHFVVVTAPGYQTNNSSVTLTPGNTTTLNFALQLITPAHNNNNNNNGASSNSNAGITTEEAVIIVGAVVGVAAILGGIMLMPKKGTRGPGRAGKR